MVRVIVVFLYERGFFKIVSLDFGDEMVIIFI